MSVANNQMRNRHMENKKSILILCTGNSCRSQMAEGYMRKFHGDTYEIYSAGIESHGMNESAIKVMGEAGVDITHHTSKTIDELPTKSFEYVLTVCDNAKEHCPFFPAVIKVIHHSFEDPPALAKELTEEEDILDCYRRVRDEVATYIQRVLPGKL